MSGRIEVIPVDGLPEVEGGAPLGTLVADAASPSDDDVVVISHKVVSKAERRIVALDSIEPSGEAAELAHRLEKDPRLVELVLRESRRIVRAQDGVLIAETRSGWICANAGIDASNLAGEDTVALLPEDPDASARRLRAEIAERAGERPAVVVSDSFGRPWRVGQTDVAVGCAGLRPLDDWRDRADRHGRLLSATVIAVADQAAAAADLVRGKDSGTPAAIVRGLGRHVTADDGPGAAALQRPAGEDLFR